MGSHMRYTDVQNLTSVIIVVDSQRTTDLGIGQLANYVAMVGLAQVRADADSGEAPSILSLFGKTDPRPKGLSPWDQSFFHGLYTTNRSSVLHAHHDQDEHVQADWWSLTSQSACRDITLPMARVRLREAAFGQ
jgi:hypothetical protein